MQEEREKQAQLRGAPAIDPDHAAAKIQKVWKGYAQRKRTKQLREEEFEFIGMVGLRTSCFVKYCVVFLRRCSPSVSTPTKLKFIIMIVRMEPATFSLLVQCSTNSVKSLRMGDILDTLKEHHQYQYLNVIVRTRAHARSALRKIV